MNYGKTITSLFLHLSGILCALNTVMLAQNNSPVVWTIDRTDSIGGFSATPLTEVPLIQNDAAVFNGVNNGLLVHGNPLGSASSFTIEMIIRPDSADPQRNFEQRYFHLRSKATDDRRILMELRLTKNQQWYLDSFVKSETSKLTLIDSTHLHPTGTWSHVAIVYENGTLRGFVNGVEETSGEVMYMPIDSGQISIGARQDPRSWFKGAIRTVKFTKRGLKPNEFMKMAEAEYESR